MAEPERGSARVQAGPVVVGKSDGHLGIFGTVAVRVTDQDALPVVVELAVGDRNACATVGDIKETIVAGCVSA